MIGTLLCFLMPHWRYASIAHSLVSVPAILLVIFLVPESPKWSETKGRIEEMNRSLAWIARFNGDRPSDVEMSEVPENLEPQTNTKNKVYTLKDLFATKHMRIRTITMMIMWFAASLSSYANDLNSRNGELLGDGELLGEPIPIFFLDRYQQAPPLFPGYFCTTV